MNPSQLQSLKSLNEQLVGFLVRLTNHYDGLSSDVDRELKTLRNHLSGSVDYSLVKVSINKVNQLLMLEPLTLTSVTQQLVTQLDADIKEFQRLVDDTELQKQAAKNALELNQAVPYISSIMPLYEKVMSCYKQALGSTSKHPKTAASAPPQQGSNTAALRQSIIDELAQLINAYAKINPEDKYISTLQKRISQNLSEEELLNSCLILIRVMVQETLNEANAAGQIVQRLTRSLNSIGSDMQTSIHASVDSFGARQSRLQKLMSAIDVIQDVLSSDKSAGQLKSEAQLHLDQLASSVNEDGNADRIEQEGVMSLLLSMQQQLDSLQKQTDMYRQELIEQRVNMYTDPLTKIPNRMAYNERAQKEWHKCQQQRRPLGIAIVDVDHFKRINDNYGHTAGDKTLQAIARHLKTNITSVEFLARWGGEEFIVLLPDFESGQLDARLNELRLSLANLPFKFKQQRLTITVSIGAAECGANETLDECFERADNNLYQAKAKGRNCVVLRND